MHTDMYNTQYMCTCIRHISTEIYIYILLATLQVVASNGVVEVCEDVTVTGPCGKVLLQLLPLLRVVLLLHRPSTRSPYSPLLCTVQVVASNGVVEVCGDVTSTGPGGEQCVRLLLPPITPATATSTTGHFRVEVTTGGKHVRGSSFSLQVGDGKVYCLGEVFFIIL
jgi:hypothetical protein